MGATPDTIWRVPAYLPYLQPPLTDKILAQAEQQIGQKLPQEFVALLRQQNGGYLRYSLPESPHEKIAGIGPHFPSLTDFDWDECQDWVSFPLQGLVPFDGDGHWHLCLDYRKNAKNPAVSYIDIECDSQSLKAETFAAYLNKLQLNVENEYVLTGVADIDQLIAQLSKALKAKFYPPDSSDQGYTLYRGQAGTSERPAWIWLSTNKALRGFVREEDDRYEELKDLMPGFAPRFPGVPAEAYILGASESILAKVISAVAGLGYSARPLHECI